MRLPNQSAAALLLTVLLCAAPAALAGTHACDSGTSANRNVNIDPSFDLDDDTLRISTDSGREFEINAKHELRIDGVLVPVSIANRARLGQYVENYRALREHANAVGMKAAGLAFAAIWDAFTEDRETAKEKTRVQSKEIERSAGQLCDDLLRMQTLEAAIRDEVPQFGPFVIVKTDNDAS